MHKRLATSVAAALLAVAGCASQPDKIASQSVSPLVYQDYQCDQVAMEMDRIGQRVGQLYLNLKEEADHDAAQLTFGLLFLWPTLFFLEGGDGPEAAEFARLKGEYDALQTVAVEKRCDTRLATRPIDSYIPRDTDTAAAAQKAENLKVAIAELDDLYEKGLIEASSYAAEKEKLLDDLANAETTADRGNPRDTQMPE